MKYSHTDCRSENTLLKDQLVDLGYAVPQTEWSMKKPPPKGGAVPLGQAHGPPHSEQQQLPARSVDVHSRDQYRQPGESRISGVEKLLLTYLTIVIQMCSTCLQVQAGKGGALRTVTKT